MDSTWNDHQELEQFEAIDDLLEDFWFFDNLLDRRSRILRYCHSDPYPFSPSSSSSSSSTCPKPEIPKIGDSDSETKLLEASTGGGSVPPPCIEKKEGGGEPEKINKMMRRQFSEKVRVQERRTYLQKKEPVVREKGIKEGSRKNKTSSTSSCSNNNSSMGGGLQRTQTLPSYIGREGDVNEFQDQEIDDSRMGFLIREAIASSSSSSGLTPTKHNTPKISSIPRHRPPRNSRSEEAIQELVVKSQRSPNRKTLRKTLSSIETKDIQMLKDLDIELEKKQEEEQRSVPRATAKTRSTAVVGQPIPVWVPKDSRKDMKAQIKFWARTVASNVRQEC
ncbi:unnamed protein product [Arabidopsis lyrata]|uniref:Uncharacterized protein n=1 Tax=Arabidopsis lyrata subsp. lyrata TaxID=81972 RepID=D7L3Z1_ARALL|nr:uncharacterized protein LOC9321135 [Arabidopsis lyrata subsp. lyrata]EFH61328.1 hypothetical protein ARALYDRAFT_478943 [Arabidopsis lyrata subsp. lyrata]CAH8260545.1 unnamed protein product [Arabidopsis lyrata]|eukprot:XP_020886654.1 uncharacterized protein LOC9321135 [Arabidopsis lyrata subsp. lyrata]